MCACVRVLRGWGGGADPHLERNGPMSYPSYSKKLEYNNAKKYSTYEYKLVVYTKCTYL